MDVAAGIDRVEELFTTGEPRDALVELSRLIGELTEATPQERDAALRTIVTRIDHEEPQLGAHLALAAGALVEGGLDARPLARAVIKPLVRALAAAKRFVEHADAMPNAGADVDGLPVGDKMLADESVDAIADEDHEAVAAFFSLDTWYRPAVAAWTRDVASLREAQKEPSLAASLDALEGKAAAAHWLGMLRKVLFDAPFVVFFPEIGEAYAFTTHGVSDVGQLLVLLAEALADPLARIGVTERPPAAMLATMLGEGAQQDDATYGAAFHLYPWQARDPATGMPRDGKFMWRAPGGTGNHSLPADFLPADVAPVADATRVLLCVGPNAPEGVRFVRVLPAVRTFSGLAAKIEGVRKLTAAEADAWTRAVVARSAS